MPPAIAPGSRAAATPMMAQLFELKAEAGDALLLMRMGDFYEAFFEDAATIAAALDIALTHRGEHQGQPVPMCGVPVHAHEAYLARLVKAGHSVALAEQMEDPAEARRRGSKALVRRAIVRVLTPGTLMEERLLEGRAAALLAAAWPPGDRAGLAWADVSTGQLRVADLEGAALADELARLAPAELLWPEGVEGAPAGARLLPRAAFDSIAGAARLEARFGPGVTEGLGRSALCALGALVGHVEATARGAPVRLQPPALHLPEGVMAIDAASRASLEIVRALDGGRAGSLLAVVDSCVTAAGARLLAEDLAAPLARLEAIESRLDMVAWLVEDRALAAEVRGQLRRGPDVARALARIAAGRGRPTDLAALRDGLRTGDALARLLANTRQRPDAAAALAADLAPPMALLQQLEAALADRPPPERASGGAIREGHDPALDEARALAADGRAAIAALEAQLRATTGIAALRIRHNGVLGYHVEVASRHGEALLAQAGFQHRQTLGQAMRFDTPELRALATRIAAAGAEALAIEARHLDSLEAAARAAADAVAGVADALARLDRSAALAETAASRGWVRPVLTPGLDFLVEGGRHPVVEEARRLSGEAFVPNDCRLEGDARVWLLTGPNMGGKSTFLRQNALIAILAQAGSFVPATSARIGLVDRLFSRVGAADNLAQGRSTFMVEMVETAAILRQASPRSLLLLDEVGRGTATWDGLALAWAILEALHDRGARTLFATHYHELTALRARLPALALRTLKVREWNGALVFLHEVEAGAAPGSFGLEVARLAGVPAEVLARAREILGRLEAGEAGAGAAAALDALPLFAAAPSAFRPSGADPFRDRLAALEPDTLTPRAALDLLYELVREARSGGG